MVVDNLLTGSMTSRTDICCPTLSQLPSPQTDRVGWPWTMESPRLPPTMPDGRPWPRISIVTPSFNQGEFIEETIRSILLQGYPNLEYIIMDGGSTDGSVEIIRKYEPWLSFWESGSDRGQAHAINKGIERATGEWLNWINSDDILMQSALGMFAEIAAIASMAEWISGARIFLSKDSQPVDVSMPWRTDPVVLGLGIINLPQDATFVRLSFLQKQKIRLREDFSNIFDTVFHFELNEVSRPVFTTAIFSGMRLHSQQKTANAKNIVSESTTGIRPYMSKLPIYKRIILRLLYTRLHTVILYLLRVSIRNNLLPHNCEWEAVIFDHKEYRFKMSPARDGLIL